MLTWGPCSRYRCQSLVLRGPFLCYIWVTDHGATLVPTCACRGLGSSRFLQSTCCCLLLFGGCHVLLKSGAHMSLSDYGCVFFSDMHVGFRTCWSGPSIVLHRRVLLTIHRVLIADLFRGRGRLPGYCIGLMESPVVCCWWLSARRSVACATPVKVTVWHWFVTLSDVCLYLLPARRSVACATRKYASDILRWVRT